LSNPAISLGVEGVGGTVELETGGGVELAGGMDGLSQAVRPATAAIRTTGTANFCRVFTGRVQALI
jgi:hypothetical protein